MCRSVPHNPVEWSVGLGAGREQSSAAVAGGNVHFDAFDRDVHAFNAATGQELWRSATGNGIFSSLIVSGGVVYIGLIDGVVCALDAEDGRQHWEATPAVPSFHHPP
jgi:outer membrane protein assembly factor BamB